MRTLAKGNQEEDDYEDDDFGARKEGPSSISNNKDVKSNDKASAIRSKHSVTEQRRRSKINERFQILRDLVPHSEQKRDTASFLLEVIDYVQYLQEKVQKYEGSSYQGWNSEPTKLIPWRNSHWRVQGFVGHHQAAKNGTGSAYPGKLDENIISVVPATQSPVESDPSREDRVSKGIHLPLSTSASISGRSPLPLATTASISDTGRIPLPPATSASISGPGRSDCVLAHPLQTPGPDSQSIQQDELAIEGGTISIKSTYTQGLLNTVSQALQNAGLDLSQASISVQIDLGKRAKKLPESGMAPAAKDYENPRIGIQKITHYRDTGSGEDSDQAQKRVKS